MSTSIDSHILNINKVICSNIDKFNASERGLLSQNILSQLRNFIEHISVKIYGNGQEIEANYHNIEKANSYVKTSGKLKFLSRFHKLLQITASHYTLDEESSVRLMLKYYEYLVKIKQYMKSEYDINVLQNIDAFPLNTDLSANEYYKKIVEKINQPEILRSKISYNDRFYIQKIKPFFVDSKIYYEVTYTRATDSVSKFDRIIAFTSLEISPNYAVKFSISKDNIELLDRSMPIQIIDKWEVSIRPCELNNFARLFVRNPNLVVTKEYYELMKYLTSTGFSLVEIIGFSDEHFNNLKRKITENVGNKLFFDFLSQSRLIIKNKSSGANVLRYLLYTLNNKIIKKQHSNFSCELLSNLNLDIGCVPFDKLPLNTSLKNHNPRLNDLLNCIELDGRNHELFCRFIKNNTEQNGQLYTPVNSFLDSTSIDLEIETWNNSVYWKHTGRKLELYKDHVYIKEYEDDTYHIVQILKELSTNGLKNYTNSVNSWLNSSVYSIDCEEKIEALKQMFENSKVSLIYGAAGTGKSTLINHIANFFNNESKLFLANTNPAVNNLKRKVRAQNSTYKTIAKYLHSSDTNYNILVIDECSTVSNSDMLRILRRTTFKLLVLVGDIFQIESILFGNWFAIAKAFVGSSSVFELNKPYRSNNSDLLNFWTKVRNLDDDLLEHITKSQFSCTFNESIFERTEEDEIILCLNYDGLYGINNINKFLQGSNENTPIEWNTLIYKVNDPILFNEVARFAPLIYNNLKGKICKIEVLEDSIQFDIEVDKAINELEAIDYDFELLENSKNGNSIIRFCVKKYGSTDNDDDEFSDSSVPFQIAYALSIHKAQGLEYNSVKIVITDEVEELITHNIFYTSITRAKVKLRIYWTPETENKILGRLKKKGSIRDIPLLKSKYNI